MFTLLVVDDDAEVRELISDALTSRTCRVVAVSSATAGSLVLAEHGVDAVIVDVHLTDSREAEGIGWVAWIRRCGMPVPVAIITSDRALPLPLLLAGLEVDAVFYKPFELRGIRRWLVSWGLQASTGASGVCLRPALATQQAC